MTADRDRHLKPYDAPSLAVFGRLGELTAGGSGKKTEAAMGTAVMKRP